MKKSDRTNHWLVGSMLPSLSADSGDGRALQREPEYASSRLTRLMPAARAIDPFDHRTMLSIKPPIPRYQLVRPFFPLAHRQGCSISVTDLHAVWNIAVRYGFIKQCRLDCASCTASWRHPNPTCPVCDVLVLLPCHTIDLLSDCERSSLETLVNLWPLLPQPDSLEELHQKVHALRLFQSITHRFRLGCAFDVLWNKRSNDAAGCTLYMLDDVHRFPRDVVHVVWGYTGFFP